jgi:hypothetical protein
MKKQRLPKGWTHEKIRKLAEYHDNLTEDEQAAEIQAALNDKHQTVMVVPTRLVPEIVKLINKKQPSRPRRRSNGKASISA